MHAVVLVGGFGTRLRPLTDTVPKPMLPVGNVPLIARLIGRLADGGVDHVTLALGFLPDPFIAAFPDQRCGDVELEYAVEPEPLDTAGAIRFAAVHSGIDDTFVVANGDIITDLDVGALAAAHRTTGAEATVHLIDVADPSAFGVADLGPGGRIREFVEKPAPGTEPSTLINAGTYVFEPRVLERIPAGQRWSVERDTFPAIVADGGLYGWPNDVYWIDAGRPDLYLRANIDLITGARAERAEPIDPAADVASDAAIVDSVIGAATVGAGARVVRSVVIGGAVIGAGVTLEDTIVMGEVGDGAELRGCVVGADGRVAPGAVLTDERVG